MFRRKASRWRDRDYLELVPAHRYGHHLEPGTGRVVVLVPRFTDPVLGRWLQPRLGPRRAHLRVPLEARGAAVWRAIDGRRSVRELAEIFAAAFPDDSSDAARRVSLYLHAMYDKGFITYLNLDG